MRLVQLRSSAGARHVAVVQPDGSSAKALNGASTTYELAQEALKKGVSLPELITTMSEKGAMIDYAAALKEGRVLSPIDHPDPAHCVVTGTGLTHLGSAEGRDKMHAKVQGQTNLTDSMKMFKMGLEEGKPTPGRAGVQPEWFYKGDGSTLVAPETPFTMPAFALNGGEEPEVVGVYVNGPDGTPHRIGFAIGNEFSDHVMEKQNYLYLAHSKLRQCAIGPELLVGPLPDNVQGQARIRRGGQVIWEKPFLSGESNMSHTLGNLEHHHFKYDLFRQPGDVHIHWFGTGTLSFTDDVIANVGDIFEVESKAFGRTLRNPLTQSVKIDVVDNKDAAFAVKNLHDFPLAPSAKDFQSGRCIIGWGQGDVPKAPFEKSSDADVDRACKLAGAAAAPFAAVASSLRAAFLDRIAREIEGLGEELVTTCSQETNLPAARVISERGRTCNQLRMFARLLREGSWVEACLDVDATNDLRRMLVALGPVGVFAASNFPLAFSAAGGDTASALAAGCPVVMKAHSAHPRTSELVARCVVRAAQASGMPEGVYSILYGRVGVELVEHPAIKAIGFTGSYGGGRMLADKAAARPEPIPVFAEMGSINPVFVLPEAIRGEKAASVAATLAASIVQGAGQFCTNPGSIFLTDSPDAQTFLAELAKHIAATPTAPMLTPSIRDSYRGAVESMMKHGARVVSQGSGNDPARPTLLCAPASAFLADKELSEEMFGPASCVFLAESDKLLVDVANNAQGQLTSSIMATDGDLAKYPHLVAAISRKVGRVIFNGVPTGVAVVDSMQHGGPFPASTDARFTSVGTAAIYRFARPLSYQGMPVALQPPELRNDNPLGIVRVVNGIRTKGAVGEEVREISRL